MATVLTNMEDTVQEFINQICDTKKIDILVGYVYFSGFKSLMHDQEKRQEFFDKPVRILVGMQIDANMSYEYYKYTNDKSQSSTLELTAKSQEQMSAMLNKEEFDDKAMLDLFIQKIVNGTLEIRQTRDPAHAKLYIFQTRDNIENVKSQKGIVITGSSNLTQPGLVSQTEFNVVLEDTTSFDKAKEVFDTLWKDSIELLNVSKVDSFIKKVGLLAEPTPYEVFRKVLCEYFEFAKKDTELTIMPSGGKSKNKYMDLAYQVDAIKDAMRMVKRHNGVIIADVVGLGKTITATCLAKNLEEQRVIDKTLIISPPHLKDSWGKYANSFILNHKVCSVGKLEDLVKELNETENTRYLIIVDEAHRFRNADNRDYAQLYKICCGNKVALLTATPFNNTSADIFSLLKLFQNFNSASISNYEDINAKTIEIINKQKELRKNGKLDPKETKKLSTEILRLIKPVLIRRTRIDLQKIKVYKDDLQKQRIELNKMIAPELHEYTLSGKLASLYENTFNTINPREEDYTNHFKGSRYKITTYIKPDKKEQVIEELYGEDANISDNIFNEGATNMSKFMRGLLVRRFESSIYAFKKTIDNIIISYENIQSWLKYDYLPIYKRGTVNIDDLLLDTDMFDANEGDEEESIFDKEKISKLEQKGLMYITEAKSKIQEAFFTEFANDLELLKGIKANWVNVFEDPKFDYIHNQTVSMIKKNKAKKIIIFSEFADTVKYLQEKFEAKKHLRTISFTAADSKEKKDLILENFDAGYSDLKDDFDILITTDTLSEGVNLHNAGILINYDIPYNPTRVIQRIGRINRIGIKKFDTLEVHNYVPRLEAQKDVRNWEISNFKMALINAIFGGDTKILTSEEELEAVFNFNNDKTFSGEDNTESWDIDYKNTYDDLVKDEALYNKIKELPPRLELGVKKDFNGIAEIVRVGDILSARMYNKTEDSKTYDLQEIFENLECNDPSIKYEEPTDKLKNLKEAVRKTKLQPQKENKKGKSFRDYLKLKIIELLKTEMKVENKEYIELLYSQRNRLSFYDLQELAKLKKLKTADEFSEKYQEIVSPEFLKRLKKSNEQKVVEKTQLLVTEEFFNK